MKTFMTVAAVAVAGVAIWLGVALVDIDQTEEARLPDVDISVEGGNMPEFEAEVGSIEVTEETMTVPDVEVTVEETEVTVPGLEIVSPDEEQVAQND